MPKTLISTICLASSMSPDSNPRGWPTPALAKTTSIRPYGPARAPTIASTSAYSVTSQRTAIRSSAARERFELVQGARAEHELVAGLGGLAGGGGADPR